MLTTKSLRFALLTGALLLASSAPAQDSGPLLDALVRKGILTNQEAEDLRADLVRDNNTIPAKAIGGGKSTDRLSVGMRMQMQYASLDTDIKNAAVGPVATDHAFLRRMYITFKAGVGGDWGATMTYDLASGGYDDAIIEWKPTPDLSFNFGLRKVNVAAEERGSSGDIRSIERSSVTRYFVESNNGRRLGAASYRIGAFLDGKKELSPTTGIVYSAAVTTPERNESFTGSAGVGDGTNNRPAVWGNFGVTGKLANNGTWITGVGAGFMPDQGGFGTTNFGRGFDMSIYSVYGNVITGRFTFMAEYLKAKVERGFNATTDSSPSGYYLQPSFYLTETIELVARYASLNSDRRGVTLSDVIRSAPNGGTMNKSEEWFFGGNYYLRGNDLKLQLGLVSGKTTETITGAPAEAKVIGLRSQMQLQF
jgi:phosphate-selective porin